MTRHDPREALIEERAGRYRARLPARANGRAGAPLPVPRCSSAHAVSKLLYHGRTLRTTSAAKAQQRARDTRVRTFKPTLDGTVRCTTCGVRFGESHRPTCEPEPPPDRSD